MIGWRGGGTDEARVMREGGRRVTAISRVVPQTDLHTRPQGTLDSVCLLLEPRRVAGLSTPHQRFTSSSHLFLSLSSSPDLL